MIGVWILNQLNIFVRVRQSLHIRAARSNRVVIIRGAVEDADRLIAYVAVSEVSSRAIGIEGNVRCETQVVGWTKRPVESIHGRVQGRLSTPGKAHYSDPVRVDT